MSSKHLELAVIKSPTSKKIVALLIVDSHIDYEGVLMASGYASRFQILNCMYIPSWPFITLLPAHWIFTWSGIIEHNNKIGRQKTKNTPWLIHKLDKSQQSAK